MALALEMRCPISIHVFDYRSQVCAVCRKAMSIVATRPATAAAELRVVLDERCREVRTTPPLARTC
jgi:hypothetical protein